MVRVPAGMMRIHAVIGDSASQGFGRLAQEIARRAAENQVALFRPVIDDPHCRGPTIVTTGNVAIKDSRFSRSSVRWIMPNGKAYLIEKSKGNYDHSIYKAWLG